MAAVVAVATVDPLFLALAPVLAPVTFFAVFFFVVTGSNPCSSASSDQVWQFNRTPEILVRAEEFSKAFSNYHLFLRDK